MPFFSFYRPALTENDIIAFNAYCEFMIAFSSFHSMKRTNKEIIPYKFYKQHYYSHKVIEKFMKTIPSYVNKTEGIYLKYAACSCLSSLIFEGFSFDYDDLFYFCDLNIPGTIYNESLKFNQTFIKELTENSEIFLFLLQIDSGSSVNILTNKLASRISMLTLEQIKNHLSDSLPNYVIRMKGSSNFNGLTFNEVKCTVVNERSLFSFFLDDTELTGVNDKKYSHRLILSNLLQHERFGHVKLLSPFEELDDEPMSPREYYNLSKDNENKDGNKEQQKENLIEIIEKSVNAGQTYTKGESGIAFNVFLTRKDERNFNNLKNINADFIKIFNQPKLFAAEDLTLLDKLS